METLPGHLRRLPAGEDRFQAEQMSRDQRERILAAMAETVAKRGYQGTSVEKIVKRAGVARAAFYEHFENREDCLLAGFEQGLEELRRRVASASASAEAEAGGWPAEVRAGLLALIGWVREEPALARTCLVETMTAGRPALERYDQALQSFAPAFRRGRELTPAAAKLPETLEDSIVGGIIWMLHQRLLRGQAAELEALLPTMLEFSLSPYLGEERAAELAAA